MKSNPFEKNKHEIIYNIVNSLLAGGLVFGGSLADGNITLKGIGVAFIAGFIVLLTKFKSYWDGEKKEYTQKLFNFI
jgi:hypothetical protein